MDIGITVKSHNSTKTHTQKYKMIDVSYLHRLRSFKHHNESSSKSNSMKCGLRQCNAMHDKKKHINNISTKEATPTTNKY